MSKLEPQDIQGTGAKLARFTGLIQQYSEMLDKTREELNANPENASVKDELQFHLDSLDSAIRITRRLVKRANKHNWGNEKPEQQKNYDAESVKAALHRMVDDLPSSFSEDDGLFLAAIMGSFSALPPAALLQQLRSDCG